MAELKIQPEVRKFVENEYGKRGLKILKKAAKKVGEMIKLSSNPSEVGRRMDGSFKIKGAHVFKKYVTGPKMTGGWQ